MDGFLKKSDPNTKKLPTSKGVPPNENNAPKVDFLRAATAVMEDKNKDVGLDKVGDLRDNLENVIQFFELVKENENIKPEIQQLVFAETLPLKPYRFIEVPKNVAEDFKQGQRLVFRGGADELVVLCSKDKTYDVKEVDTSNSLLLVPNLKDTNEVISEGEKCLETKLITSVTHNYLELKEIECVSVFRLRELLHENKLSWDWTTKPSVGNKYTLEGLLNAVRMSEGQLYKHLQSMPVIEFEGFQRWLSYDFRDQMIERIISACDDDVTPEVNVNEVTFEGLRSVLPKNVCDPAISWFIKVFCREVSTNPSVFKMDHRSLVRSVASFILRNVSGIDTDTFERHIDQNLPAGVELDYSFLYGLCIVADSFKGRVISYLNVEDLPEDPRERLKILFNKKQSWRMEEISPFLVDICSNTKSMSGLMVRHCRATKDDNGEKVFCSLRPV